MIDRGALLFGSLLLCLFIFLRRVRQVQQVWCAFRDLPTYTRLVSPITVFNRFFPRIPPIADGADFGWRNVHECQSPRFPEYRFLTQLTVYG